MAAREVSSTRSKQFAFKYFNQVHARVKKLEAARDAQQPKRQPLIDRGGVYIQSDPTGGEQTTQPEAPDSEIHAGEVLIHSKHLLWE